jgi:nitrite reductase (NO-forming)/hydroxylamine reductase
MTYQDYDPKLEESTNRWMAVGVVFLFLFVLAFPVYWLLQPNNLADAQAAHDAELAVQGEEIFNSNCAQCHGGEATGAIAPALNSEQFLGSVTDLQMHQLISTGVPGTLMVAYSADFGGTLTQQQITATVAYLRGFEETAPDFPDWLKPLAQTDLDGEELYNMACSYCHGIDLEGNIGPALGADSGVSFEDDAFIEERIRNGMGEMPAFGGVFTDDQIDDIIGYLRVEQDATTASEASTPTALPQDAVAGLAVFEQECASCHTVGGGTLVGPDLAGITDVRDNEWLHAWIIDPEAFAESDSDAAAMFTGGMPASGLSDADLGDVIVYLETTTDIDGPSAAPEGPRDLSDAELAEASEVFFNRCAGCHGVLRAGATGPAIQPEDRTLEIGTAGIQTILTKGTPGGMPAWGDSGILSEEEIELVANFIQLDPPTPPPLDLDEITESWELVVPVADRPTEPQTSLDWEDFTGVILRDAGQVAIIDAGTKETVAIIDTGFAVHILRSSATGRYFIAVGRDGRVTMIDLWTETPEIVAQVQGCFDARSVEASKVEGFEDKFIIEGCYWPPQYVVFDGLTLEPLVVHDILSPDINGKDLEEVRVAAIVASHFDPVWVMGLKESGYVAIVDYSLPDFPLVKKIEADLFLHDGGWDHTGRYFITAANAQNKLMVVDVKTQELVAGIETGKVPHPGRGANWQDPEFGWVYATTHIGEGKLTLIGADPEGRPDVAWTVVREIEIPGTGSLFLKTHPNSQWVWMDTPLSNVAEESHQACVYSIERMEMEKCFQVADHGAVVHFEYNKAGDEVWISVWDKDGEVVIYDDETLTEKHRITGDWLITPTGKFNVFNTANDIY